jgi:hypothetical protein
MWGGRDSTVQYVSRKEKYNIPYVGRVRQSTSRRGKYNVLYVGVGGTVCVQERELGSCMWGGSIGCVRARESTCMYVGVGRIVQEREYRYSMWGWEGHYMSRRMKVQKYRDGKDKNMLEREGRGYAGVVGLVWSQGGKEHVCWGGRDIVCSRH